MTVVDIQEITDASPIMISMTIREIKSKDATFNPAKGKKNKWMFTEDEANRIIEAIRLGTMYKKNRAEYRKIKNQETKDTIQELKKTNAKKKKVEVLYKVSKRIDGMWVVIHCGMTKEQADNMELELYCQGIRARVTPCIRRMA